MPPTATQSAADRRIWVIAACASVAAGALAVHAFVPLIAVAAVIALVTAVVARPRGAVLTLALATPFYDLAVLRVEGIADIRILEVLWLGAAVALAWRVTSGAETRLRRPPSWVAFGLAAITGWFFIAAAASSGGIRPFIEATQTLYLCVVAYLVAAVVAGSTATELARWLRPWALLMTLVIFASLIAYGLGLEPIARTVVTVPDLSVEYVQRSLLEQSAGSLDVDILRLGILNTGPVGTAALLLGILTVALATTLTDAPVRSLRPAYALLAAGSIVLLLTYSRAGWVLAVLVSAVLLVRSTHPRARLALAALIVAVSVVATLPGVASRIEELTDPSEGSYQAHGRLWVTAVHMVGERPVIGWGPGMYAEHAEDLGIGSWMAADISADQPHNWVLEIAAETGLVGAVIAIAFILAVLIEGLWRLRSAPLPVFAVWMATAALLAINLTLNAFRTELMWVWLGALIGVGGWYRARIKPAEEDAACAS